MRPPAGEFAFVVPRKSDPRPAVLPSKKLRRVCACSPASRTSELSESLESDMVVTWLTQHRGSIAHWRHLQARSDFGRREPLPEQVLDSKARARPSSRCRPAPEKEPGALRSEFAHR